MCEIKYSYFNPSVFSQQNVRDNASVGKASTTDDNIGQVEDMLVDTSTEAAPNAAESHEIVSVFHFNWS